MKSLRVIPLWKLRRQYHRRRMMIQAGKKIAKALLLGVLIGTAAALVTNGAL